MAQGRAVTGEAIEKLLQGLRLGMTRRAASGFAGFSKTTLYRMLENDDGTLGTEMEKAEAMAEATYSTIVANAAADPKNWTAAAWWLERRHPSDYARREKVEITVDLRREAERLASELGLDVSAVMAEAEAVLRGGA